jgi:uncharacterized protein YcfJ
MVRLDSGRRPSVGANPAQMYAMKPLLSLLALPFLMAVLPAEASRWSGVAHEPVAYATVLHRQPVWRQVQSWQTVQHCAPGLPVAAPHPRGTEAALAGALIGGVAGYQFGSGRGQTVATAAGAVIGAELARHHALRGAQAAPPRCTSVQLPVYTPVFEGYDVTYQYQGQVFTARLPQDPGAYLPVRVSVQPLPYR